MDAALARLGRLLPRIDPELAPAVQGYLDYLGRVRAVPTARDAARRLRSLEAADAVRARYARAATDRARYLDDVEARERTGRLAGGEAWTEERLRVSKYLDAVERARGASAPP